MPTYHEIMDTDLASLITAAESWDAMATEFAEQEEAYGRDVEGVSLGKGWSGLSAQAANGRFRVTLEEFRHAQTEAKAVASLLRDAHAQFAEVRGRLGAARQEAVEAGMRVSDQGLVCLDTERMAGQEHRTSPDDPASADTVRAWQERLHTIVRQATDADLGVRIALNAVTADPDPARGGNGFNGQARGDVETYEGRAAEQVLARLGRGERLSAGEIAGLHRAFRDNQDDPAFSRALLDGLGARGTVTLASEVNDLVHVRGGDRVADYEAIGSGLANALASATRDTGSRWYEEWRADLREAGADRHATDFHGARLDKAVGYQSLVTLMRQGDGYSAGMLSDLTDDMIAAERKDPGIWQLKHEYSGTRGGWFANDPVDGMLGIMSRDPGTAARYLSDDGNMTYLVKDRDWDVVLHEREGAKAGTYAPGLDGDDRRGFGAALLAGATGIDPSDPNGRHVEHTGRNDEVFRTALRHFADRGDDLPPSLREPMATMLANHGDTVHRAMSDVDMGASPLDQTQLVEVAKQVSKDRDAYSVLNAGMNQAIVSDMQGDAASGMSGSRESLIRAGRTVGFLEEARTQAQGDPEVAEFAGKPVLDTAISYLPVVSAPAQQAVDYVTEQWLGDEQKRLEEQRTEGDITAYEARNRQLMALAEQWEEHHDSGADGDMGVKNLINAYAEDGIKHARGVSGRQGT
ncbi:hypothetical protein [Streptomyces sp. UH6]|uniref:hypothetical protein n=1 Tax=Streptomyces sp. UH6 TaxID=2748379 RepID=UPI0015D49522|nr:hypothetical protein [Streptomyces sp. UH6]NYV73954.1 hypothetical protein [Streptomyces sp. UH6]